MFYGDYHYRAALAGLHHDLEVRRDPQQRPAGRDDLRQAGEVGVPSTGSLRDLLSCHVTVRPRERSRGSRRFPSAALPSRDRRKRSCRYTSRSSIRAFDKAEKMHTAAGIARCDDRPNGNGATPHARIAIECGHRQPALQVAHLQRVVPVCGNRPLAVRRHRRAQDRSGVAFQGARQCRSRRMKRWVQRPQPGTRRRSPAHSSEWPGLTFPGRSAMRESATRGVRLGCGCRREWLLPHYRRMPDACLLRSHFEYALGS